MVKALNIHHAGLWNLRAIALNPTSIAVRIIRLDIEFCVILLVLFALQFEQLRCLKGDLCGILDLLFLPIPLAIIWVLGNVLVHEVDVLLLGPICSFPMDTSLELCRRFEAIHQVAFSTSVIIWGNSMVSVLNSHSVHTFVVQ